VVNLQVARLAEYLNGKGIKASNINFPNRTTAVGSLINSYLQSGQELGEYPRALPEPQYRIHYPWVSAAYLIMFCVHTVQSWSL
jgi:hypothetical protein